METNTPDKKNQTLSLSKKLLIDLLKEMKKEILDEVSKSKSYSEVDKFINEKVAGNSEIKLPKLDDFHLKFSKNELKELLIKYGENIQNQHFLKTHQSQQKEKEFYQNYQNLNYLLWYYYQYDKDTYSRLLEEYNNRLHNHLLSSLGLPPLPQFMYQKPKEKSLPKEKIPQTPNEEKESIEEIVQAKLEKTNNKSELIVKKDFVPHYNVTMKKRRNADIKNSKNSLFKILQKNENASNFQSEENFPKPGNTLPLLENTYNYLSLAPIPADPTEKESKDLVVNIKSTAKQKTQTSKNTINSKDFLYRKSSLDPTKKEVNYDKISQLNQISHAEHTNFSHYHIKSKSQLDNLLKTKKSSNDVESLKHLNSIMNITNIENNRIDEKSIYGSYKTITPRGITNLKVKLPRIHNKTTLNG